MEEIEMGKKRLWGVLAWVDNGKRENSQRWTGGWHTRTEDGGRRTGNGSRPPQTHVVLVVRCLVAVARSTCRRETT